MSSSASPPLSLNVKVIPTGRRCLKDGNWTSCSRSTTALVCGSYLTNLGLLPSTSRTPDAPPGAPGQARSLRSLACPVQTTWCRLVRCTGAMDEEDDLTPEEIDALFKRTQPIGNALNAVYRAELIVAAVDDSIPPAVRARLDATIHNLTDEGHAP